MTAEDAWQLLCYRTIAAIKMHPCAYDSDHGSLWGDFRYHVREGWSAMGHELLRVMEAFALQELRKTPLDQRALLVAATFGDQPSQGTGAATSLSEIQTDPEEDELLVECMMDRLRRIADDQNNQEENAPYEEDDEEVEDGDLLRFTRSQSFIRDSLVKVCRNALSQRTILPHHAHQVACFLWLFLHLPKYRPEVSGRLSLVYNHQGGYAERAVAIGPDGLELSTEECFNSGAGHDSESTLYLLVSRRCRDQWEENDAIEEWLEILVKDSADPDVELSLECHHSDNLSFLKEIPEDNTWPKSLEDDE